MKAIHHGIYLVSFDELKNMQDFDTCVNEYRQICRTTGATPITAENVEWYEQNGKSMYILAVIDGVKCVGFCGLIENFYPHINDYVLATETMFVRKDYAGRYWLKLFNAIKELAKDLDCAGLILSAQKGSRFEKLLSKKCQPINTIFWVGAKNE